MRVFKPEIQVKTSEPNLVLSIFEEQENSLSEIDSAEADENGEAPVQILESGSYGYYFSDTEYQLKPIPGIAVHSKGRDVRGGRITPGIFVGTLSLEIYRKDAPETVVDFTELEVLSTKLDIYEDSEVLDENYRINFRSMLDDIAGRCSDLLLQINSPVSQRLAPDFNKETGTIYQRFAFVKSLIASEEFQGAVSKVLYAPASRWREYFEPADIRRMGKVGNFTLKQIISGKNRFEYEFNEHLSSVPNKLLAVRKRDSFDIPENRFIKHALENFAGFCESCEEKFFNLNYSKAEKEADLLARTLRNYLENPFFREISNPEVLILNSPLLQRKSGYREVLNAWTLFDLAARLIWMGGDNVYKAGKRDIAVLYEYWLFFQLYSWFVSRFDVVEITHNGKIIGSLIDKEDIKYLTEETADGLGLKLKSGVDTSVIARITDQTRPLSIRYSYNRTFRGGTDYFNSGNTWRAADGSWTKPLRPDYTFSIWPASLKELEAEENDMIVHIHFDAKYKLGKFIIKKEITAEKDEQGDDIDSVEKEKREERRGIYRNADLMKMHAYKDAIRRTGGAYVLYPGEGNPDDNNRPFRGFHEIIPGLGAFGVKPSADNSNTGISEVAGFLENVIMHFQDRANQRERIAAKSHLVHKSKKKEYREDGKTPNITSEPLPEYVDLANNIKLIPDETSVLIGYYKNIEHLNWIKARNRYNVRTGTAKGAMALSSQVIGAEYILLHTENNDSSSILYKINHEDVKKPRILSVEDEIFLDYPKPNHKYYLVFSIEKPEDEFEGKEWNFTKLKGYSEDKDAFPFFCTLTELMGVTKCKSQDVF